jgi:hypothetical protein
MYEMFNFISKDYSNEYPYVDGYMPLSTNDYTKLNCKLVGILEESYGKFPK